MNLNAVWKGLSVGAAVGSMAFMAVKTMETKKHNLRRDASRTLKSAKSLLEDVTSAFL